MIKGVKQNLYNNENQPIEQLSAPWYNCESENK